MSQEIEKNYLQTLEEIKLQIKTAQVKAHLAVNKEMLILYWQIGKTIIEKQKQEGWGTKIIDKLADDLRKEFSEKMGFSPRNLKYMRSFAKAYPDLLIVQVVLAQLEDEASFRKSENNEYFIKESLNSILNITWYHNLALLDKVKDQSQRLWYANQTIKNGWSRNVLVHQINSDLYSRQAKKELKINNFAVTLPLEQSEMLQELIKDEYNFGFIDIKGDLKERKLENALIDNVIKFLLELGQGFALVGKQYHLEVDGQDFYIDLLLYHIKLRSYIVLELKTGKFKPEYTGKMGFYLSCVDDYLKTAHDNSSIGIILCEDENHEIKKRSLSCMIKPIGVSSYKIAKENELPEELRSLEEIKRLIK
jgi:predicted nuclease of restriction endonuclease-like (RecB) superfamily